MQKLKVIHIINSLKPGGAENLVCDIHKNNLATGIASKIVSIKKSERDTIENCETLRLKSVYSLFAIPLLFKTLYHEIKHGEFIIHIHLFPCQFYIALISLFFPFRKWNLVTTEHSTSNKRRKAFFGRVIDRFTFSRYDSVICISKSVEKVIHQWQPSIKNKTIVIHNGIDLNKFTFKKIEIENAHVFTILSVGRLVSLKNHKTLLHAVALLNFDCKIIFAGEGPLKGQLQVLAKELKIDQKVSFIGNCENIQEMYRQSDCLVHIPLWEGFGLVIVEAMAMGVPVVASDLESIREVIGTDLDVCQFVEPENIQKITSAITLIHGGIEKKESWQEQLIMRAQEFSITKTAKDYYNYYLSVNDMKGNYDY